MGDALRWIEEGFERELGSIAHDRLKGNRGLELLGDAEALELGRRGAREALAPLLWKALAGETFDTTQVTDLLDVTRQAINKRVRKGTLLALPGKRTTHFPVWQFDLDRREVRSVVQDVLQAFVAVLGELDPYVVTSWASSPQHEELEGLTPQDWLLKGADEEMLKLSAQRAAAALAA
jgi:hypothetical protein